MVEDDYDGELRYDRRPVGALQGSAPERVLYVGTASRMLGPALRLGWAVLPDGWIDEVTRAQDVATQGLDVTSQLTFASFLNSYAYDRLVRSGARRTADGSPSWSPSWPRAAPSPRPASPPAATSWSRCRTAPASSRRC